MKLTNQEILADILISAREDNNYSLRKLSVLSGVSHSEISMLEKGMRKNPNIKILKKLTDALDLNYEEVLEAIGYIKSDYSFEDKTDVLSENEKEFIINSVISSWDGSIKTDMDFTDKQELYKMLFGNDSFRQDNFDINKQFPKIAILLRNNFEILQDAKHKKKLTELIKWYIDLIGSDE